MINLACQIITYHQVVQA